VGKLGRNLKRRKAQQKRKAKASSKKRPVPLGLPGSEQYKTVVLGNYMGRAMAALQRGLEASIFQCVHRPSSTCVFVGAATEDQAWQEARPSWERASGESFQQAEWEMERFSNGLSPTGLARMGII